MTGEGFTLDDSGRRVQDGWDHDGDLIASLRSDLNRLASFGDALAAAARRVHMVNGSPVGLDALADAVEAWDEQR